MRTAASGAAWARRLRVGTLVLNDDFRHPVLLAREAALVDVLSDGRLQLGLGAGYMKSEYEQAGLAFRSTRASPAAGASKYPVRHDVREAAACD